MKLKIIANVTALAFALSLPVLMPAMAQEVGMDMEEFYRCLEVADADENLSRNECIGASSWKCIGEYSTASGKANCWSLETELWDDLLNQEYQILNEIEADAGFKAQLRDTQRVWIKFRDTDCGLFGAMGITAAPGSQLEESCRLEHTARRANALLELRLIAEQTEQ